MKNSLPALSKEQYDFMAVLSALGNDCLIDVVGFLAPLLPRALLDLLDKTEAQGWMKREGSDRLVLSKNLPPGLQNRLDKVNTTGRLTELNDLIIKNNLAEKISPSTMAQLFEAAGRLIEASQIEIDQAQQALGRGENETAKNNFQRSLNRIFYLDDQYAEALFINGTLQFSNICFFLGKGLIEIPRLLHRALELSKKRGDRRSHGLINLHFGRLFYFTGQRDKALVVFSVGYTEIKELGDQDILTQAAAFLGIYFFMQGKFLEALNHFEKVEAFYQQEVTSPHPLSLTPVFIGYCSIYLGRFQRAIGYLDFYWRLAREHSDWSLATTIRSVLGTVFILIENNSEGLRHLKKAQEEAKQQNNALAQYFSGGGLSLYHYREGDIDEAYKVSKKVVLIGEASGLIQQIASPWILEALYDFHRQGYAPIPHFEYHELLERFDPAKSSRQWKKINIHLQGVALRLKAKEKMDRQIYSKSVRETLSLSETCLREAGDPVQLSRTLLELARWELSINNHHGARQLAQQAWQELGRYAHIFFQDDFRALLDQRITSVETMSNREVFHEKYFDMLEMIIPAQNLDEMLSKVVRSTNRFFGAERGGLFWFSGGKPTRKPKLRSACNLTGQHVSASSFKNNAIWVQKAFLSKKPLLIKPKNQTEKTDSQLTPALLCIPITIKGTVSAVLYHDNSHMVDAFDFFNTSLLTKMALHLSPIIERLLEYEQLKDDSNLFRSSKTLSLDSTNQHSIITESPNVLKLLKQTKQIARSNSTVLITGESGTGKELLAEMLHNTSSRSGGPLIIVDSTTIPENLFESELFGHEKGAFTGADRQRKGYIELANGGTLLLDEIGELPLQIQIKLLRVLQEKTYSRVGGNSQLRSDFRLISATNRNLRTEVAKGRFREDLFYRLNVVHLDLPPLRDRGEDAYLLAQQFVHRFCHKHGRKQMKLTPGDKSSILQHNWPGNVRELMNIIERSVILSPSSQFDLQLSPEGISPVSNPFHDKPTLAEIQRRYINYLLEHTGGKISGPDGIAEILGLKRSSIYARFKSLGIKR